MLWHQKSHYLPKAPSQSPRIQLTLNSVIRMPISNKEGTAYGGPGALWHLKSRFLSKTVSPKPNPDAARRLPKAGKHSKTETGKLFREFGASRILEFCAFAEKNAVSLANQDCKGGQNGHVDRAIASGDILGQLQK